ncbi:dehydrogenase reductase sdr family member 8 precursor [Colletotrichum kahawae]|uniref:Short-chain dehydrogenase/reductase 3 n=1 Tax=Colletotrichum kahawae TaxID=34407 RepID=A0AAD9YV71_COLKA|nr:dehydrogenase reductase sdr family member 8 precursor [Colletotrichum kahawae]
MATLIEGAVKSLHIISGVIFNPVLSASTLSFLTYGPPHLVTQVTESDVVKRWIGIFGLKTALKILTALGICRFLNRIQNLRATSNWSFLPRGKWNWPEEIAVVTGGCNGIGKAIVLALVQRGVRVAILDVAELPSELQKIDTVFYYKCDISSASAVAEAADSIRKTVGHPAILINNAGIVNRSSILNLAPEKASKLFGVNLMALWYTAKAFLPNMILKNKGHIVTIASMASYISLPTAVDYSASKAGALAFHEGLSGEIKHVYQSPGVLTTVAHPMWVATDMTKDDNKALERGGTGKMMKPEDVAKVVADQIFSRRGAQLIIPPRASWLSGFRGFPNWFQEMIRDSIGK